jgi:hypothetical protein
LTLPSDKRTRSGKVLPFPNNLYAQWRLDNGAVPLLHEPQESPPERLLQAVWQYQRLRRDRLFSLDGRSLRILHPGFLSREGGPDFRRALIQIGDDSPKTGDVEVDIQPAGWRAHGHDRNPAFAQVILRVIWDGASAIPSAPSAGPTMLALQGILDAPLGELAFWLDSETVKPLPPGTRGRCADVLRTVRAERLTRLLRDAARIRFRAKAGQFQARARQAGWEQALWEGLFRALGYKHNTWPMHCLAEQRPAWAVGNPSSLDLQARLLGIGNLLPHEIPGTRSAAHRYLRSVWDSWWREREEFRDCILPESLWRFHGQRPANHPQRRLALAAHWLARQDLPVGLQNWCATGIPHDELSDSLMQLLQVEGDAFWSWHWTLRSSRMPKPQPLLGRGRLIDLAANVILPWLWSRAAEGRNAAMCERMEQRFDAWPAADDNAVLRLARLRLLGGAPRNILRTAAEQQGLIQITRDFCDGTDSTCRNCRFPDRVREWNC